MKTLHALAPLAALAIAGCASTAPAPVAKGQVTGSVLYRERIMLPPTATVTVSLADTSLMDAPAKIIDTQVLTGAIRAEPISSTTPMAVAITPNT